MPTCKCGSVEIAQLIEYIRRPFAIGSPHCSTPHALGSCSVKNHCRVGQMFAFSDDFSASLSECVILEPGAISGSVLSRSLRTLFW